MRIVTLIGIMMLLGATDADSCTVFKTTQSGKTFIGNSEDWVEENARVWFVAAGPGKHGRVLFGFENGWAQGGMNDQGLFFDGIASEVQDWTPVPGQEDFPGNLCELILEEAATVDDAVGYFERYNFPSLLVGQFIFVDATGNTAAISYEEGQLKVESALASNYTRGYRSEKARDLLGATQGVDVKTMRNILKACQRRDEYATQYGNIYDPLGLKVYVYPRVGAAREVAFDLEEELAQGNHYYDLARLSEQMETELIVDHKTRPVWSYTTSGLNDYVGHYSLDTNFVTITRAENNLLIRSDLILDAVIAFKIVPVADDQFVARHLAIGIEFQRDRQGKLNALFLSYDGRIVSLQRK